MLSLIIEISTIQGENMINFIRPSVSGEWLHYDHLAVNCNDGNLLLDQDGQPLRASTIKVYASDIKWKFSEGGPDITSANGYGGMAPATWRFPGANVFGIILSQKIANNDTPQNILVSTENEAQEFNVYNTIDIYCNVNDGTPEQWGYADNNGSYSLRLKIIRK